MKRKFAWTSKVTQITLPNTLETIGESAFQNCENLYQVIAKGEFTDIDEYAFYESPSNQITIVADRKSDTYVNAASNGFVVTDTTKQKIDVHGKKMFVGEKKYISVYNNPYKVKWSSSKNP